MKNKIIVYILKSLVKEYDKKKHRSEIFKSIARVGAKQSDNTDHINSMSKIEKEHSKNIKKYKRYKTTLIEIIKEHGGTHK